MKRSDRPLCDCCGDPSTVLLEMDGISEVDVPPRSTPEQVKAAPRRPSKWCEPCARGLARWQASQRRRAA